MSPSGVGGVAISGPFAHRYGCPMPIGSTLSVLAARVCVPSLRVRQLLLVWSSGLCVSQVGGRGRVGSTALFGAGSGTAYRPRWTRSEERRVGKECGGEWVQDQVQNIVGRWE